MNIELHIYHREVLFEKIGSNYSKLYYSIIDSQKQGRLNANSYRFLYKLTTDLLKSEKFKIISKEESEDLRQFSIQNCFEGFKYYKDDGNFEKCYKYFVTLIYHGLYSTT